MRRVVTRSRISAVKWTALTSRLRRLNPRVVDAGLALGLCATMCVVGASYRPVGWRGFDLWAYLLTGLIWAPLAARRAAPMLVMMLASLAYGTYLTLGYFPSFNVFGPMLAFYTVATIKSPRVTAAGAVLVGAVLFYSGVVAPEIPPVVAVAQGVVTPAVIWLLGGLSQQLGRRNQQLAHATEELRREQEHRVEHAVTQERLQVARELHDVVAHHLSVIAMQAGLARYVFDTDPATARTAVHTIGDTSRDTLEELRRVLNLLRASDTPDPMSGTGLALADPAPAPGLAQLGALVERVRGAGVQASVDVHGEVDDLPSGLQLTIYRVVQEALTNAVKHAGPCRAGVVLRREPRQVVVTITNDAGPVTAPWPPGEHAGGGHGLLGMHERARLYGATLRAQPQPGGGFTVELTVPWPS